MVAYLGNRTKAGAKGDANNPFGATCWTVTFTPADLALVHSHIHHIAISGPAGSSFQLFLDTTFFDYVARGDINSWDPSQMMPINPGQTMFFYWNSGVNPAPKVTVFLQQT